MDAQELRDQLAGLDVLAICRDVLNENEDALVDAMQDQMAAGFRADGTEIKPSYRWKTVERKQGREGLSGVTEHVTLFDEGDHYAAMYAEARGEFLEMGSTDSKAEDLQEKYSGENKHNPLYGLNEESVEGVIEERLQVRFEVAMEKATGLKFE